MKTNEFSSDGSRGQTWNISKINDKFLIGPCWGNFYLWNEHFQINDKMGMEPPAKVMLMYLGNHQQDPLFVAINDQQKKVEV
jgi:hypothetical protein